MTLHLDACLYIAAAIFSVGVYGVLSRQNLFVLLMCLELMLNAGNLALVAFGRAHWTAGASDADAGSPQVFVLIVIAVAAAEVTVGLAILLAAFRQRRGAGGPDDLKGEA